MTQIAAPSGYMARTPTDMLIDTGVLSMLVTAVDTVIGVSRGGLTFDPGFALKEIDYDGRRAPIVGGDRVSFRRPTISGTMLQLGPEDWRIMEPGAAGTVNVVTPKPAGLLLVIGEYVPSLTLTFSRSGPGTVKIKFPYALCTKYGPVGGKDEAEAEIAVTFEARLDRADVLNTDNTLPYIITISDT
jgi:hypothetical protein